MHVLATSFDGAFHVTDLTSGLSGGATYAVGPMGFSGNAPTSRLRGHRYSGTLTGIAEFFGYPVAKTEPNHTLYTYKG